MCIKKSDYLFVLCRLANIHKEYKMVFKRNSTVLIFLILASILSFTSAFAKERGLSEYYFKHIGSASELSHTSVTCIAQDSVGYMWFGTYSGLNRYDGKHIRKYKITDDTTQMRSYFVRKIKIDSKNNIWIATNNGLGIYNKNLDIFQDARLLYDFPRRIDYVGCIEEDSYGGVFVTSTTGIFRLDLHTKEVTDVTFVNENGEFLSEFFYINRMQETSPGIIYFSTHNGLYELHLKEQIAILKAEFFVDSNTSKPDDIHKFVIDRNDIFWIGTYFGSAYRFDPNTGSLSKLDIPTSSTFNELAIESDTTLLMSLDTYGVIRYFTLTNSYEYISDKNSTPRSIKNNKTLSIFIDRQKTLWLGHFQDGVSFTSLYQSNFHLVNSLNVGGSFHRLNSVSSILKDKAGTVWIGTDGKGLYAIDPDGEVQLYTNNPQQKQSLPSNAVLALHEDRDGELWMGTFRGGLTKIDKDTRSFTSYTKNSSSENSISGNDVRSIDEDSYGRLWIGIHGFGFSSFDKKTASFFNVFRKDSDSSYLLNNWCFAAVPDKTGEIWLPTTRSLSVYDTLSKQLRFFQSNDSVEKNIAENIVYTVFCDSKNRLWAGTDRGLYRYMDSTGQFGIIASEDGLPEETIASIEEDDAGMLWLGTNVGLFRYDPATGMTSRFTMYDGLQANEFITNSVFKDREGSLYFGGVSGFNYFNPQMIHSNKLAPTIVFTDIELMGTRISPRAIDEKALTLPYNQNFVTFHFVALNFIASEKNRCKYKLIGLDTDWKEADTDGKAVYTSLPPGKYTFNVIGANNDGVWNMEGSSYRIEIRAPWWETWWFRIGASLIIIGGIVGYYALKLRNIHRQNAMLEDKVNARTIDLKNANQHLAKQYKIVEIKNEELKSRNAEIHQQNKLLRDKQEEIEQQHYDLQIKKAEILNANEELSTTNNQLAEHEATLLKTNNQLQQLVNTKDKMLSIIAHDLKNPMNTLIGFSSIIMGRTQSYTPDKLEQFIGLINTAAVNAYKLLENLLTWARSQTGNISLEIKHQDLLPIVSEDMAILHETAEKKGIALSLQVQPLVDTSAFVDANTVSTIFRNLISNAIKFTPHGGNIFVGIENKGMREIEVSIKDSGVGMTDAQMGKLFLINKNNSTPGTDSERGTGLGLVICQEFTDMNNGRIEVSSTIGVGTRFTIILPKQSNT